MAVVVVVIVVVVVVVIDENDNDDDDTKTAPYDLNVSSFLPLKFAITIGWGHYESKKKINYKEEEL